MGGNFFGKGETMISRGHERDMAMDAHAESLKEITTLRARIVELEAEVLEVSSERAEKGTGVCDHLKSIKTWVDEVFENVSDEDAHFPIKKARPWLENALTRCAAAAVEVVTHDLRAEVKQLDETRLRLLETRDRDHQYATEKIHAMETEWHRLLTSLGLGDWSSPDSPIDSAVNIATTLTAVADAARSWFALVSPHLDDTTELLALMGALARLDEARKNTP